MLAKVTKEWHISAKESTVVLDIERPISLPDVPESYGVDGIANAKLFMWQELNRLANRPDLGDELFQRFATALNVDVELEGNIADLKKAGLGQYEVGVLNFLGFMHGYRGDEGYMPQVTLHYYREQIVRTDDNSPWQLASRPQVS